MRMKHVAGTTSLAVALLTGPAVAGPFPLTSVPNAQPKVTGNTAPNVLSPELGQEVVAQGSTKLEPNSDPLTKFYGYDDNGPMIGPSCTEATKTEPDKNTYLDLTQCAKEKSNCPSTFTGADANFNYGQHFLFQGHENGLSGKGYITRINLDADSDADGAHRVTLLATQDVNGKSLPTFDGLVWGPWTQRLLFTAENGSNGGVWQATPDYPSQVEDISVVNGSCVLGRASYEGIQNDSDGNLWIVEDSGGTTGTTNSHARRPNSFVYRFIPNNPSDLQQGGKLQALQVLATGGPITFGTTASADAAIKDPKLQELHTCGKVLKTTWVDLTLTAPRCDANAAAKAAGATPFKRPENGQFRPRSNFREFFFDETGDTNLLTEAGTDFGGFGSIFKLTQQGGPSASTGTIEVFYLGNRAHTGFDNVSFWSKDEIVFVEDAGDTVHTQRGGFDSAYLFDVTQHYCGTNRQPTRILAQGRDASATLDSACSGTTGFQNDGDNEITGWHTSDGDPTIRGLLGTGTPTPFQGRWRTFYTQQHGDNVTYELTDRPSVQ